MQKAEYFVFYAAWYRSFVLYFPTHYPNTNCQTLHQTVSVGFYKFGAQFALRKKLHSGSANGYVSF